MTTVIVDSADQMPPTVLWVAQPTTSAAFLFSAKPQPLEVNVPIGSFDVPPTPDNRAWFWRVLTDPPRQVAVPDSTTPIRFADLALVDEPTGCM